jgi:hypothetical protein
MAGMTNKLKSSNFTCGYCGKEFVKEKTLAVHVCEKKRRHLSKNEKHVVAAMMAYQKFYEMTQRATAKKTFDDFVASPYYNAFVKFGSFIANANPIYPERFVEWVIKSQVKLDHWCRDSLYDQYLTELVTTEPADGAIQRSIKTMMDWAEENNSAWEHYFAYVNLNRAVKHIKDGLISPWVMLNSAGGKKMLKSMNDEQLAIITPMLDLQLWTRKFKTLPADVELVKAVLHEAKVQ